MIIKSVLDVEQRKKLLHTMRNIIKEGKTFVEDNHKNADSTYKHPAFQQVLYDVKPFIERVIGKEIYPTYSFSRLYRKGSILEKHFDRPACQVSLTLQVYSDGDPWPIFVCDDPHILTEEVDPSTIKEYKLEDGDAVLYNGCDQIHWRDEYTGKEQHQIFLHYVIADGPHKDHKDDALLNKELANG
tara:strand:+ start:1754 stop:2311 length:558 start_codon:yes stop_codon:yes gene_type:complete